MLPMSDRQIRYVLTDLIMLPDILMILETTAMPVDQKPARPANHGDSDVSPDSTPSQFILVRSLEPSVTEELLAKGVGKLYKPTSGQAPNQVKQQSKVASTTGDANLGAREGTIRRILLVRDRRTNESWRYGFAEFATVDDAQAALTRYNSFEKFTISSKPVLASYIHAGVFVPVLNPTPASERFTFSPLNNSAMKLAYWDEDAYVTELTVTSAESEAKGKSKARSTSDNAATAAQAEGLLQPGKESEAKAKKRKADAAASASNKKAAAPSHLQFWSNRHAELHGIDKNSASESQPTSGTSTPKDTAKAAAPPSQSYADPNRLCCYLCSRQFKSMPEVNKHERLSQLHRDNLLNDELKAKAVAKLARAGITINGPSEQGEDSMTPEYRDRARERRRAFGPSKNSSNAKGQPTAKVKSPSPSPPPAAATASKGASLLNKMGWSTGQGLGATGEGRMAAIETEMYVQGVGLGASGGKVGDAVEEAGRNTKGDYGDWVEKGRDRARERFEKLG